MSNISKRSSKKSKQSNAKKSTDKSNVSVLSKLKSGVGNYFNGLNYLGLVVATLAVVVSFLPSLLPRSTFIQALVTGLSMVAGYGVGALISHLIRWSTESDVPAKYKPAAWKALFVLGPVFILLFAYLGSIWHGEVRALVGMEPDADYRIIIILPVAVAIAIGVLALSRSIRGLFRRVKKWIDKAIPRRISIGLSFVVVTYFVIWVASGLLGGLLLGIANNYYGAKDNTIPPGYEQPESTLRSGSPESYSSWETIGYQGRKFVAAGPSVEQIESFSGDQAVEPIRIYAGLKSAETAEDRAELVVKEIKRTGAFNREVLILANTTGSGWLEAPTMDSIEYIHNGNTAIVAQQYSYLPSWISYLVDQETATLTSQAIYDAVYSAWSELPEDERPKLYSFGLSLGSFGGQTPYSGVNDLRLSVDGALFQGTPNFTNLWRNTTNNRDNGSPEWQPIYKNGVTARFASTSEDINRNSDSWDYPRLLYMQHASDPVVWFDFSLLTKKPDWLNETRGPDVSPATRWYPIVTFFQVTVDQMFSTAVPHGHGHNYGNSVVDAWVAVTNPADWSQEKSDRLQTIINEQL
jgi:uncharacterized membrane protein